MEGSIAFAGHLKAAPPWCPEQGLHRPMLHYDIIRQIRQKMISAMEGELSSIDR
jgi:hypothetical protein